MSISAATMHIGETYVDRFVVAVAARTGSIWTFDAREDATKSRSTAPSLTASLLPDVSSVSASVHAGTTTKIAPSAEY